MRRLLLGSESNGGGWPKAEYLEDEVDQGIVSVLIVAAAAASAVACPYSVDGWTGIAWKRDLPSGASTALGAMAERGEPFQATDALPKGTHPPFARFVVAHGRGCRLRVSYEHGGMAHGRRTVVLTFVARRWIVVAR